MSLREELQNRADQLDTKLLALSGRIRAIERESDDVHTCINALDIAEMDAQDAALEPAPEYDPSSLAHEEELAPALADPPSAELRSVPGAEEEVRDQFTAEDFGTITIPGVPELSQEEIDSLVLADEEDSLEHYDDEPFDFMQMDRVVTWEGGECPVDPRTLVGVMTRDGKVEQMHAGTFSNSDPLFDQWKHSGFRSDQDIIAYRVTFPDETHTDDVRNDSQQDEGAGERADPQSVTTDPDFVAAVSRAEATLAAAEPALPTMDDIIDPDFTGGMTSEQYLERLHSGKLDSPAYVGLQDAQLDADWDAMKEREKADKPKLHFSIFGERGNRKLEDVE
jgi:hypothetical protein